MNFARSCSLHLLLAVSMWAGGSARVGSLVQQAPDDVKPLVNPYAGNARAAQAGGKLYGRECAACHGEKGEGLGRTPALTGLDVSRGAPGAVFWVLRNGSLHRGMPSFAHLPEPERWQIVTFVQSLHPGVR